jgi:DNA-binding NarL/FixJ family response regulator
MEKIKVLLVDDQALFVESLRMVLETRAEDIVVVGVASNGKIALQLAAAERPDVILMDVCITELDGIETIRILRKQFPSIKMLVLTTCADDEYVVKALHFGVTGYLLKDTSSEIVISALRNVYQGRVILTPQVAAKLADRLFQIDCSKANTPAPAWLKKLNDQEKEILRLLATGYDNKEIAAQLYFAEQTVKNYISIIYRKMGVRDRVQALRLVEKIK